MILANKRDVFFFTTYAMGMKIKLTSKNFWRLESVARIGVASEADSSLKLVKGSFILGEMSLAFRFPL